jgi:HSF-type DNA-binding
MIAPTHCPSKLPIESRDESKIQIGNSGDEGMNSFPQKLYKMLECASEESFEEIISWEPNGRCFVVRDMDKFAKEVLPR